MVGVYGGGSVTLPGICGECYGDTGLAGVCGGGSVTLPVPAAQGEEARERVGLGWGVLMGYGVQRVRVEPRRSLIFRGI